MPFNRHLISGMPEPAAADSTKHTRMAAIEQRNIEMPIQTTSAMPKFSRPFDVLEVSRMRSTAQNLAITMYLTTASMKKAVDPVVNPINNSNTQRKISVLKSREPERAK